MSKVSGECEMHAVTHATEVLVDFLFGEGCGFRVIGQLVLDHCLADSLSDGKPEKIQSQLNTEQGERD